MSQMGRDSLRNSANSILKEPEVPNYFRRWPPPRIYANVSIPGQEIKRKSPAPTPRRAGPAFLQIPISLLLPLNNKGRKIAKYCVYVRLRIHRQRKQQNLLEMNCSVGGGRGADVPGLKLKGEPRVAAAVALQVIQQHFMTGRASLAATNQNEMNLCWDWGFGAVCKDLRIRY